MITVKKLTVGQLGSNCYLATDADQFDVIIIDPGDDADYIQNIIADAETTPSKIVATHGHFDHVMAAYELKHVYNIPFLMHKSDEFLLSKMQSSAKYFTNADVGHPPTVDEYIAEKSTIKISEHIFKVIEIPGHTPGSICLYCQKGKIAFVGDLVFEGGFMGRVDYSYSNQALLENSIKKILNLPKDTIIYPGHGNQTTISDLKKTL